jgi:hypothetical protein
MKISVGGAQEDCFPSYEGPTLHQLGHLISSEKVKAVRWNRIIVLHNESEIYRLRLLAATDQPIKKEEMEAPATGMTPLLLFLGPARNLEMRY